MRSADRNSYGNGGFTLVELAVVLAISALLLTVSAGAVFSYQSYAGYKRSNEYARTIFLGAQAALSRRKTSGMAEELTDRVERLTGEQAEEGSEAPILAESGCERVYVLEFREREEESCELLRELLAPYVADEAVFQGTFLVELDPERCVVQGVFYSGRAKRLIYGESSGNALGIGEKGSRRRDAEYRKKVELGYYGA